MYFRDESTCATCVNAVSSGGLDGDQIRTVPSDSPSAFGAAEDTEKSDTIPLQNCSLFRSHEIKKHRKENNSTRTADIVSQPEPVFSEIAWVFSSLPSGEAHVIVSYPLARA